FPGLEIGGAGNVKSADTGATIPKRANDVIVSLPAGDEGARESIAALAARSRDDLARRLDTAAPARLVLRFHPTVESYQRATGQAWYTAGATVGDEIHFVPLT